MHCCALASFMHKGLWCSNAQHACEDIVSAIRLLSNGLLCWAAGNCNGDSTCRDDFFSDQVAIQYYKDHVKTILNRVNTFNQRLYRCLLRFMTGTCAVYTQMHAFPASSALSGAFMLWLLFGGLSQWHMWPC